MSRSRRSWLGGARGRGLRAVGTALVLASAFGGASLAAIHQWLFEDVAAVSDTELEGLRGGFTIPSLPHVQISFGFEIHNRIDLPPTISPSLVAVMDHGGPPAGSRLDSTTSVQFSDPTRATVRTVHGVDGSAVRDQQRLLDLTKQTVTLQLGRPDAAVITQHLDAHQVTTLMQSVLGNTSLRSDLTASITLNGWDKFRSTLPSPAAIRGVRAVEDAVRMSVR